MATFADRLKARAIEAVRQSPAALARYQQRHAWDWMSKGLLCVALPLFVVGSILLPCSFTFAVYGPSMLLLLGDPDPPLRGVVPPGIGLALHGVIVAGVLCLVATLSGQGLFCERTYLSALTHAPCGQRALQSHMNRRWREYLGLLVYWNLFVFGFLAWSQSAAFEQVVLLVALAVLHAWMAYAATVCGMAMLPRRTMQATLCGIAAAGLLVIYLSVWISAAPESPATGWQAAVQFVGYALPTGWVDGLAWHGVIQGNLWAWLWLIPIGGLSAAALWVRSRVGCVREIHVSPHGALTPLFVGGDEPIFTRRADTSRANPITTGRAIVTRATLLKRMIDERTLAAPDWSRGWPIELLLGRMLTTRQRRIVEHFHRGQPTWTLNWLISAGVAFVWVGLLWLLPREDGSGLHTAAGLMMCLIVMTDLIGFSHLGPRLQRMALFHPIYPIGLYESMFTALKVTLLRLFTWLPLVAGVSLVENILNDQSLMHVGAAVGGFSAAALLSVPMLVCLRFEDHGRYDLGLLRFAVLVVVTLAGFGGAVLWLAPHWTFMVISAVSLGVGSAVLWGYFHWLYHSGPLDFALPDPFAVPGRRLR